MLNVLQNYHNKKLIKKKFKKMQRSSINNGNSLQNCFDFVSAVQILQQPQNYARCVDFV